MNIREAFSAQGFICESLGSAFMGRLMPLIGERLTRGTPVADRILDWPGDVTAAGDSVPLRLAGALHALKINGLALSDVYPPVDASDDNLWTALEAALEDHQAHIMHWLDSAPQTNEVRRAACILPALAEVARLYDQPVELLEVGASAGLNLCCDHFRLVLPGGGIGPENSSVQIAPDWTGPLPATKLPNIVARKGNDLNPLDPKKPEDRLRLLAYLWPDQPERLARTEAAIELTASIPTIVEAGDAGDWIETQLADPAPDRVRVLYHTVAWQYFPKATTARALAAMKQVTTPLVQIGMEADGGKGAAITLTTWPDGETRHLGRASFHGIWMNWSG